MKIKARVRLSSRFTPLTSHSLLFGRDALLNALDDLCVDPALVQLLANANRVFNRAGVRAAVADQTIPGDPQQRGPAVLPPVVPLVERLHDRTQLKEQVRVGLLDLRDNR